MATTITTPALVLHPTEAAALASVRAAVIADAQLDGSVLGALLPGRLRTVLPLAGDERLAELATTLVHELTGFGVLQRWFDDPAVTDVMVFGSGEAWIERHGRLQRCGVSVDAEALSRMIERVLAPLGRRLDRASPIVDARLADGARLHAVIPPIAVDGPCLTIRRFATRALTLDDFTDGSRPELVQQLREAVALRRSIVVSGATGAGKTALLNALAAHIGDDERLVTIEDSAELAFAHPHVVRLEARPSNTEHAGAVTLTDLVRAALRMRPDRIVVGEVRGAEVVDMLTAMSTGHRGSLSTVHANSAAHALERLATMVLWSGVDVPLTAVRSLLGAAVDLVVHVERAGSGARRVREVLDLQQQTTRSAGSGPTTVGITA